jgi:hypothetical protein
MPASMWALRMTRSFLGSIKYCRAHLQDAIYAVSTALINDLKKR